MISTRMQISPARQGILFMLAAYVSLSMLNIASKMLHQSGLSIASITFYRSACSVLLFLIPAMFMLRKQAWNMGKKNVVKGIIDFLSTPTWVMAVTHMPIAQAVGISYITPMITALLAGVFLKDELSLEKWVMMSIGFLGVMIIAHPNVGDFNSYVIFAIATCFLWASANVLTKNLTGNQHPILIVFFTGIIVSSLALPWFLQEPQALTAEQVRVVLLMSLCATTGYLFIAYACRATLISNLVPYDYMRMIASSVMAYFFFGQTISINTIVGSIVIFGAALYLARKSQ